MNKMTAINKLLSGVYYVMEKVLKIWDKFINYRDQRNSKDGAMLQILEMLSKYVDAM